MTSVFVSNSYIKGTKMGKHVKHKNPGIASLKVKSGEGNVVSAGKGKSMPKVATVGRIS